MQGHPDKEEEDNVVFAAILVDDGLLLKVMMI